MRHIAEETKERSPQAGLRSGSRQYDFKMSGLFIALASCTVSLLGIEATLYLLRQRHRPEVSYGKPLYQYDELLGSKPKPNVAVPVVKVRRRDEKIIYKVTYSFDSYGRRLTPASDLEGRSKFILFFGDSFTFGEGVHDNETLPFYVGKFARAYRAYNYGFMGYGPQHMLAKLQRGEITGQIEEKNPGILVYTFIDHHIHRAIGSMQTLSWGRDYPYYTRRHDGELIREGSFIQGRPFSTFLYLLVGRSQMLQHLRIDLPRVADTDIRLASKIIEESRNNFKDKFHSDDFYVLIYPGETRYTEQLIRHLERARVKWLDYSTLSDRTLRDKIPGDGHPTAKAYQALAVRLTRDIGILTGEEKLM